MGRIFGIRTERNGWTKTPIEQSAAAFSKEPPTLDGLAETWSYRVLRWRVQPDGTSHASGLDLVPRCTNHPTLLFVWNRRPTAYRDDVDDVDAVDVVVDAAVDVAS